MVLLDVIMTHILECLIVYMSFQVTRVCVRVYTIVVGGEDMAYVVWATRRERKANDS